MQVWGPNEMKGYLKANGFMLLASCLRKWIFYCQLQFEVQLIFSLVKFIKIKWSQALTLGLTDTMKQILQFTGIGTVTSLMHWDGPRPEK